MQTQLWSDVEQLFDRLLDIHANERDRMLDEARTDYPPEVIREVEALLASLENSSSLTRIAAARSADDLLRTCQPGDRIGPWEIVGVIGTGGQGQVYRVQRTEGQFDQEGALKIIPEHANRGEIRRFLRERQLLAELKHPAIPVLLDGGVFSGQPYLVSELVPGATLAHALDDQPMTAGRAVDMMLELCDAVSHAHSQLVIHRDIKPQNVMVKPDGSPVLLDFGTAHRMDASASTSNAMMTLSYAAPEQLSGKRATATTDVYQLAATLVQMLTGKAPFRADDPAALMHNVMNQPPRLPSSIPTELRRILEKALRKEADDRYRSVDSLQDDLLAWKEGTPVKAMAGGAWYRMRKFVHRHAIASTWATLAIIAIAAGFIMAWQSARDAKIARDEALEAATNYQAMAGLWGQMLASANPETVGREVVTAADILEMARTTIPETAMPALAKADLMGQLAGIYLNRGEFEKAATAASGSLELAQSLPGKDGHFVRSEAHVSLGTALKMQGNYDTGAVHVRKALEILNKHLNDRPDYAQMNAYGTNMLATLEFAQGRCEQARALHQSNARASVGRKDVAQWIQQMIVSNLAELHVVLEQFAQAEESYRGQLASEDSGGSARSDTLVKLGRLFLYTGHNPEARSAFEAAAENNLKQFNADHHAVLKPRWYSLVVMAVSGENIELDELDDWRTRFAGQLPASIRAEQPIWIARVAMEREQWEMATIMLADALADPALRQSMIPLATLLNAYAQFLQGLTEPASKTALSVKSSEGLPADHTWRQMAEILVSHLQGDLTSERWNAVKSRVDTLYADGHIFHSLLNEVRSGNDTHVPNRSETKLR